MSDIKELFSDYEDDFIRGRRESLEAFKQEKEILEERVNRGESITRSEFDNLEMLDEIIKNREAEIRVHIHLQVLKALLSSNNFALKECEEADESSKLLAKRNIASLEFVIDILGVLEGGRSEESK